jgi:hypothetical protein
MVDTADSKSADRKVMPVRVRPPLPRHSFMKSDTVYKPLKLGAFSLSIVF